MRGPYSQPPVEDVLGTSLRVIGEGSQIICVDGVPSTDEIVFKRTRSGESGLGRPSHEEIS